MILIKLAIDLIKLAVILSALLLLLFAVSILIGEVRISYAQDAQERAPMTRTVYGEELRIDPARFEIAGRQRIVAFRIINRSDRAQTYRCDIIPPKAFDDAEDASDHLRVAPRQFVLGPGEMQTGRIGLRDRGGMHPAQTHMARLACAPLPPPQPDTASDGTSKGVATRLTIIVQSTFPIYVKP